MSKPTIIGFILWIIPAVTIYAVDSVIFKGASWWTWVPILALSWGFQRLLDWYVRESYAAAIRESGEA